MGPSSIFYPKQKPISGPSHGSKILVTNLVTHGHSSNTIVWTHMTKKTFTSFHRYNLKWSVTYQKFLTKFKRKITSMDPKTIHNNFNTILKNITTIWITCMQKTKYTAPEYLTSYVLVWSISHFTDAPHNTLIPLSILNFLSTTILMCHLVWLWGTILLHWLTHFHTRSPLVATNSSGTLQHKK